MNKLTVMLIYTKLPHSPSSLKFHLFQIKYVFTVTITVCLITLHFYNTAGTVRGLNVNMKIVTCASLANILRPTTATWRITFYVTREKNHFNVRYVNTRRREMHNCKTTWWRTQERNHFSVPYVNTRQQKVHNWKTTWGRTLERNPICVRNVISVARASKGCTIIVGQWDILSMVKMSNMILCKYKNSSS